MKLNFNQSLRQMGIKPVKSTLAVNYASPDLLPNSDYLTKTGFLKRIIQSIYKSRSEPVKFSASAFPQNRQFPLETDGIFYDTNYLNVTRFVTLSFSTVYLEEGEEIAVAEDSTLFNLESSGNNRQSQSNQENSVSNTGQVQKLSVNHASPFKIFNEKYNDSIPYEKNIKAFNSSDGPITAAASQTADILAKNSDSRFTWDKFKGNSIGSNIKQGIRFVKIASIEELPPEQVYDIEVEGQCVTGDTILPILAENFQSNSNDLIYKQIKDIKGGEQVLSLNEATGKIEPHTIKGLLDMGVQPIYKLTTEDGWTKVIYLNEGEEIAVANEDLLSGTQSGVSNNSNRQQSQGSGNIESFQRTNRDHNLTPFQASKLNNSPKATKSIFASILPLKTGKTIDPRNNKPKLPAISDKRSNWTEDNFINNHSNTSGIKFVKIASIEELPPEQVYDIEVEGQCVTGDTGKIESHTIKGLLDMGVQPLYKLTTEDGKTIRTTGNYPYLARTNLFRENKIDCSESNHNQTESNQGLSISSPEIKSHNSPFENFLNLTEISKNSIQATKSPVKINKLNGDLMPKKFGPIKATPNQAAEILTEKSDTTENQVLSNFINPNIPQQWIKVIYLSIGDEIANTHNFVANGIIAHNTYISGNIGSEANGTRDLGYGTQLYQVLKYKGRGPAGS